MRSVAVVAYHSSPLVEPGAGDAGGMTIYVRQVAAAHAAEGVRTDVFTRATSDRNRILSLADGVRVISIQAGPAEPLPKQVLPFHIDEFVARVLAFSAMQRTSYDVVHSHYWQSGLAGVPLSTRWSVPLVHSQHTLGRVKNLYLSPDDEPEPRARIEGEERVIREAGVVVASTDDEWEQLSCLYGASHDRLKIIHPGIDHGMFKPGDRGRARNRQGLSSDDVVLLSVGRIQPLKGLTVAIRAAAELVRELDRGLRLLIVGGPSGDEGERELARLRGLVNELSMQEHVRFLGPQPHKMLPNLYRAADALVICSHSESFGLTALEAHACGIPVVATAVGGLKYVVHNGMSGWLLTDGDPRAFADKLRSLVTDDSLRRSFSQAAIASARRFTWERTAGELLELYGCLLENAAPEACTC